MCALQIEKPPPSRLKTHLSVDAANHPFRHYDLALGRSPDPEGMSKALLAAPHRTYADPYANRLWRIESGC
ncbi:MAG: hypothetical protein NTNFB01_37940 [Nitrospira sp.]